MYNVHVYPYYVASPILDSCAFHPDMQLFSSSVPLPGALIIDAHVSIESSALLLARLIVTFPASGVCYRQ